ncbi:MAG: AAA family ATPase [Patescibacteria group bacterium]|nr:AAA family ATPase [Patescibacteria group bacterium]
MANKKIIIGLIGEIASGKGTIYNYLSQKYDVGYHRFSTILRDILDRLHKEINRENMQKLSTILRENFEQDILAKVIAKDVKNDQHKIIIVDGVRRFADIKYLKKIKGFKLVYIIADIEKRYKRVIKRSENSGDKTKTFDDFKKENRQESEIEIGKVGERADIRMDNNNSFEELYKLIEKII